MELQKRERKREKKIQVNKKIIPNSHLPCCVDLASELICHFQKWNTHTVWWKSQTRGWLDLFNSFVRMCPLQWKPISQFKRSDWLQCVSRLSVCKEDTPEWTCTASKLTHCPFHSSRSPFLISSCSPLLHQSATTVRSAVVASHTACFHGWIDYSEHIQMSNKRLHTQIHTRTC